MINKKINNHDNVWVLAFLFMPFALLYGVDEPVIDIEIRTFGWGFQGNFQGLGLEEGMPVYMSQFSEKIRYSGPPLLELSSGRAGLEDLWSDVDLTKQSRGEVDALEDLTVRPTVTVELPEGSQRVLLIFVRRGGGDGRLQVAAIDDSLSLPTERNVHFYNLTSLELMVRAFGQTQLVAPAGQTVWLPRDARHVSDLGIAIRDPEARLLYSSRFRLRDERRMVIFASMDPLASSGPEVDTRRIQVSTVTMSLRAKPYLEPSDLQEDLGD
jgi:hypothetical protein